MKIRREKGVAVIIAIIVLCLCCILLFPDKQEGIERGNSANNSNYISGDVSNLIDNDISQADSPAFASQEVAEEDDNTLIFLMDLLSYERSANQKMIVLFAGIMILYLIIIGPASYFYLKRMDKMERMWLMIPVTAVLFGCIVIFFSNSFTIREPQMDILAVESPGRQTKVYAAVTSAGEESYRIYFNESVDTISPLLMTGEYVFSADGNALVINPDYVFEKDYLELTLKQKAEGTFASVYETGTSEIGSSEEEGEEAQKQSGIWTFQNKTGCDFTHVMVCNGESYCIVAAVEQGGSFKIEEKNWMTISSGWKNDLQESLRLQSGLSEDEEQIFDYAWKQYEQKGMEGIYLAGIRKDTEQGIVDQGLDMIAYGLYYQYLGE